MHTATFETAKLLADAGFPKPAPDYGQTWYTHYGIPGSVTAPSKWSDNGEVFAPTATDIMRELPGWNLSYTKVFGWIVYWDAPGLPEPIQFSHENPAEAAAQAWFHEKAPLCKKCNTPAKRGTALKNILAGSSEWADGSMEGATLTLSGNADLIKCWKCPECGHSWQ